MANLYKLFSNGVKRKADGACIPNDPSNKDWVKYQQWLAEGNTPDPEYTQEELDQQAIDAEVQALTIDLKRALVWQFRMILELFEVGKAKGIWINTDFDATIRAKAADWKTKLDRLTELGA